MMAQLAQQLVRTSGSGCYSEIRNPCCLWVTGQSLPSQLTLQSFVGQSARREPLTCVMECP